MAAPKVLLETYLPGVPLYGRGKARDVYDLGDMLLIVATDRISAYDCVMPNGIPGKGRILTQMSEFWFNLTREIAANHFITDNVNYYPKELLAFDDQLVGPAPCSWRKPCALILNAWCAGISLVPAGGTIGKPARSAA